MVKTKTLETRSGRVQPNFSEIIKWVSLLAALGGVLLTRPVSYLLFHLFAEMFSIVMAFSVFIVAWNSSHFTRSGYLMILGMGAFYIALIDALHMVAFKGMGVFPGNSANLPTQLWLAGRYLQAFVLLIAPFFLKQNVGKYATGVGLGAVTALLLGSIFAWQVFPTAYVDGVGLTSFKIISEYVIIAMLLVSAGLMWANRSRFDADMLKWLTGFVAASIASEFMFTLYVGVTDIANLIGHIFKIVAFYSLYRAVVETGFTRPYDLIFRQARQNEAILAERVKQQTTALQDLYDNAPIGYHSLNAHTICDVLDVLGYLRDDGLLPELLTKDNVAAA